MARASALLVGLKSVDPQAYGNWDGTAGCWGCELDVDNMQRILTPLGYRIATLKTAEATHDAILASLYRAAETTVPGDIFVFYYSGHGGQQPDYDDENEQDGMDETLVAFDREVVDDKIHRALLRFKEGVRLVMISDSCNSGSNYREIRNIARERGTAFRPIAAERAERVPIKAQLIHLGGCRDGHTSAGYYGGGAFTMTLCEVWDNGSFEGSFKELHAGICDSINAAQRPQYNEYGPVGENFRNQQAFAVVCPDGAAVDLTVLELLATPANLTTAGDTHRYRFSVQHTGRYVIETVGDTDLTMSLFGPDSADVPIANDDDSGDKYNPRIAKQLEPGTYMVHIRHYNTAGGTGPYGIRVWS